MDRMKMRAHCCAALLGLTFLTPATQAAFVVTGGSTGGLPVSGNDYNGDLLGLGLDSMTQGGYLTVDQSGFVDFYLIGAESTYSDTFTVTEHPSMVTSGFTDPRDNDNSTNPMTPFNFGGVPGYTKITIAVTAGERLDFQFSNDTNNNVVDNTLDYLTGRLFDLGIVFDSGAATLDQLVLAYDDQFSLFGDDNHDDLLIRADFRPVPIPAAIWLFGAGLAGLIGVSRRK